MIYSAFVKFRIAIVLLIASCGLACAQTNEFDLGDVIDSVQQLAQENLDPDVFNALQELDRKQIENFLKSYEDDLQGDSVLNVAQLKAAANIVLPLLDAHEETQPYAEWLQARLDYFDVAEEMNVAPMPGTNKPNPTFKTEQEIWIKKVPPRPLPKEVEQIVPQLKTIFTDEGVPPALVWLAEVESGFNARARSPAGAVGMYQLMPATAKNLGLSLFPFDERKQWEPAAHAAAKNLRQLHDQFSDWRLAVAAYNCGAGTVAKLLKRYDATSYEGIAQHLPAETQMYVPKVEATILHREGLELEKLKVPADK